MPHNLDELTGIIAKRDNISMFEAQNLIDECGQQLREAIDNSKSLEVLEDIVMDYLGLEPDFLELYLMEF